MDTGNPIFAVEIAVDDFTVPVLLELLSALDFPPTAISSYEDVDAHAGTVYILGDTPEEQAAAMRQLESALPHWASELPSPVKSVRAATIKREDWSESWKRYFHPFRASRRVVIRPSWEECQAEPGDELLAIDPGMCFGTGSHGTTMACIQYLDEIAADSGEGLSFIDAGCGSGILSMAARKLGYGRVFAFDYDPQCIAVSRENLARCGVSGVELAQGDVHDIEVPFQADVVVANILGHILLEADRHLLTMIRPGGSLVLSGILNEQFPAIASHFARLGMVELERRSIKEWTSGRFMKQ